MEVLTRKKFALMDRTTARTKVSLWKILEGKII